jgi:hypothetical protein
MQMREADFARLLIRATNWCRDRMRQTTTAGMRHDEKQSNKFYATTHQSRLGLFPNGRPKKPNNGVRLSRNPRKTFF